MVAELLRPKPESTSGSTLGGSGQGAQKGEKRPTVRIVRCSRHLLDRDNAYASSKFLIDRLVEAQIIPGDKEEDIILEVTQLEVTQASEVGTSVTISWP